MRIDWDDEKNIETNRKRGLSFSEVAQVLSGPHAYVLKSDDPEQFIAIGFIGADLITVVHEIRSDDVGEYVWIVTYWKSTKRERVMYEESQR